MGRGKKGSLGRGRTMILGLRGSFNGSFSANHWGGGQDGDKSDGGRERCGGGITYGYQSISSEGWGGRGC